MRDRSNQIGFSQRVRLEWLEQTALMVLAGNDKSAVTEGLQAALWARANGSATLKDLIDSPSLFPFRLQPLHAEDLVRASSRIEILHHGLDEDLVMLRKPAGKALRGEPASSRLAGAHPGPSLSKASLLR